MATLQINGVNITGSARTIREIQRDIIVTAIRDEERHAEIVAKEHTRQMLEILRETDPDMYSDVFKDLYGFRPRF